ncbi:MAG TPA: sensor domain-containing diguanylate cyclase [Spirochaetota bacterium]|nr:sensor domain-containing diguanylate cyclase [Spirochaetota bacterium]HOR43937.1 sensor domain-containing diguanylate cyclase [Spirochaetota bacterium]HOU85053.1 sensor domain-containing diguanylate cyclase [Spirochaetota bacterium]HPK55361.1 sensor domain-containing diguanylate cyclase [Spirochaetota bacterium]HQE59449.1 sensor domain-containing diguanylate cyclase [Spirochaetota bacterium]
MDGLTPNEEFIEMMRSEKIADQTIIDALDKKVYDMRNLIEVGASLSSNLEFNSLVDSILYSCIGQMFIEKIAIMLEIDIDNPNFMIVNKKGYPADSISPALLLPGDSPLSIYLTDNPFPVEFESLYEHAELVRDLNILKSLEPNLLVPMKSKNSLNGIVIIGNKIQGGLFSADEREFLRGLGRFASIAVENSRLYQMATMDRMTKLYIHHYFQQKLLDEIKNANRYKTPLSVFISDIDHFKKFNDTYGHQQGDIVLKEVAVIFKEAFRKLDVPARYGGEEFAVILPDTDIEKAVMIASRYRKRVEAYEFTGQKEPLHVTVSIGVAQYDPNRDFEKRDIIERADKALYKAKESGRNRVAASK